MDTSEHFYSLFPQELAGGKARDALEEAGEMMREVKTEEARGLADVVSLHQQTFRLIYNIMMYIADGRAARCLMDDIAEITWRIGQF